MVKRTAIALWALGAGCVLWGVGGNLGDMGWRQAALALSLLLATLLMLRAQRHEDDAALQFDGLHWHLQAARPMAAARLMVALDLQQRMLVRLVAPGQRTRWCWLERQQAPLHWLDLRRAAHAMAPVALP